MAMYKNRQMPASVKVVAIIFMVAGLSALVATFVEFAHGIRSIDLGVLNLVIGTGLLALLAGWRTCGSVLLWTSIISLPIFAVFMLAAMQA